MNKDIFNFIYLTNFWTQKSGPGSDPKNAQQWIETVNSFLSREDITTVLDIGCGDFRIGKALNLDGKVYTGVDVSSVIIEEVVQYSASNIKFVCDDVETMDFPETDLILIKDVLMHLPYKSINAIMDKTMKKAKYALICNDFKEEEANIDISAGQWRNLDLLKNPFNYELKTVCIFRSENHNKIISLYTNPTVENKSSI